MANKNQYDSKLTKDYNNESRINNPHQYSSYATWLEVLGNVKDKKILDLACGGGISTRILSALGSKVLGVDISQEMLDVAIKNETDKPEGNQYILGDASVKTLYPGAPFEIIAAAFLLHYASTRKILEDFVENISLNLKKGGSFVTINLSPDHPLIAHQKDVSHSSKWLGLPWQNGSPMEVTLWSTDDKEICKFMDYYWTKKAYEEVFTKFGLKIVEWREIIKSTPTTNMLVVIKAVKE